ncbi:MAG: Ku protein [Gemmatimonadota bacterium]|nr:Ku protein [Gemmatimonadota bacterium]
MAATIWKGAISFGLVNIPVTLHTAARSHDLNFRQLHEKDQCRVKYKRVCGRTGKEIPWEEIVKGYEYEREKYVVLTEEDLEKAASSLATSKAISLQEFVASDDIDPRYYEKPYYLVPAPGAEKPYVLLREGMRASSTVGVGTITLRKKQYLAALKPVGRAIMLDLLRYGDEVVSEEDLHLPGDADVKPQELKMARQLIENLTEEFDPSRYKDEYRENLLKIINGRLKNRKITLKEAPEPEPTPVINLMERLQESLTAAKKPARKAKTTPRKEKARKTA